MNRWTAVQIALYVAVPALSLVGWVLGTAWCVGRYS